MVIPYMPMVVPPVNWTGYDNLTPLTAILLTKLITFMITNDLNFI